ncbi:MAG: TrmH family RNA methyltransferase [Bacteroidia bacterium]
MSKSALKIASSLHHKKNRLQTGLFLVEGEKLVDEAFRAGFQCRVLFLRRHWYGQHTIPQLFLDLDQTERIWLADTDMDRITQLSSPPPVVGIFEWKKVPIPSYKPGQHTIWMYLDRIRDAGNLGTLLRVADWFGVEGVWTAPGTVDHWNAKSIQASMGSVFRVPVEEGEPAACIEYLKGISVYAASLKGMDVSKVDFNGGGLLLLGNESEGLRQECLNFCSAEISIPGYGQAESLNAAIAGGIILSWMRK